MRITKVYTKIGDKGSTMLASGDMVPKTHVRIAAYGDVDELNSCIALLLSSVSDETFKSKQKSALVKLLLKIQNELFDIGGELATPMEVLNIDKQQVVKNDTVEYLEKQIDLYNAQLEPLSNFVLPGGSQANAYAHLCRTVCRRAERSVVLLSEQAPVRSEVVVYLNRLSDCLFVLSRVISKEMGVPEILWQQKK